MNSQAHSAVAELPAKPVHDETIRHSNPVVTLKSVVLFTVLTILNISVFVFMVFENQMDLIATIAELQTRERGITLKLKIEQIVTGQEAGRPHLRYDVRRNGAKIFGRSGDTMGAVDILAKDQTVFSEEITNGWHRVFYGAGKTGWMRDGDIAKHIPAWQTGSLTKEDVNLMMGTLNAEGIRNYAVFLEDGSVVIDSRNPDRRSATTEERKLINYMMFRNDMEGFAFSQKINLADASVDMYFPVYYTTGKMLIIRPTIGLNYIEEQKVFLYRQCFLVGIIILIVHILFVIINQRFIISPMVKERVGILRRKNREIRITHKNLNATHLELQNAHSQLQNTHVQLGHAHEELSQAHEIIQHELDIARDMQLSLIPLHPPEIAGYSFVSSYYPAEKVGGDYYDFLQLDENRLGVLIADASGHGIPAALLVSMAKITFSNPLHDLASPSFMLEQTNVALKKAIRSSHFLTAFYVVIDTSTGVMFYARAGHPKAILYSARTQSLSELQSEGIALGLIDNPSFEQNEAMLEPGDRLILFSDGLTEAFGPQKELYGTKALKKVIAATGRFSTKDMMKAVLTDLKKHRNNSPQNDDITVVIVGRESQVS